MIETVSVLLDGRPIEARPGQTIAGAATSHGCRILSRSFKYHRPRGYTCGLGACPNCAMTVNGVPGTPTCVTPARHGDVVWRERGVPSAGFDLLRLLDLLAPWLGAGFQFRHLTRHPRLGRHAETVMGRLAGGGRRPGALAPRGRLRRLECDVAVVGAGPGGCAAAAEATQRGARVVLVERHRVGGQAPLWAVLGGPGGRRARDELAACRPGAIAGIELLSGTAIGIYEGGVLPVACPEELVELRPRALIAATGSYGRPLLFARNDLPGVMTATAALRLTVQEGILPGRRAVVVCDRDEGHELAAHLSGSGVRVAAIVDLRDRARAVAALGWGRLAGLVIDTGDRRRLIRCDLACLAVGDQPADELARQGRSAGGGSQERMDAGPGEVPVWLVGAAAGDGEQLVQRARSAGREAAWAAAR